MNKNIKFGLVGGGILALVLLVLAGTFIQESMRYSTSASYGEDSVALGSPGMAPLPIGSRNVGQKAAPPQMAERDEAGVSGQDQTQRLIIKNGYLSLVVKGVPEAVQKIHEFAAQKGGFVVSSNISKETIAPYGEVVIRIPAEVFDGGVQELKNLGEVKSERVNGQDVTEENVDLNAQLNNLKLTESQFVEIMKKATKIEDVLAVQRELTQVRGEIERLEGRIKYLEQSAKLSTLTVYLSTDPEGLPIVDKDEKWKPVAVFKDAVRNLIELGKGIVNAVIWLVVFIPVWAIIFGLVWWLRRWWKRQ